MKLAGAAYVDYWQTRIAKGSDQVSFNGVGADKQGDEIWEFIQSHIADLRPRSILDFGCGYGRMMRRMHALWPNAKLHGVDLCREALDSVTDCGKPKLYTRIPKGLRVDLVFDCLALQHITDDTVFIEVVESFRALLTNSGRLVLFDNVSQPGASHVRDMSAKDYMDLWPELQWQDCGVLTLGLQAHALMIGAK